MEPAGILHLIYIKVGAKKEAKYNMKPEIYSQDSNSV